MLFAVFCGSLICYFSYHIVSGSRGILAYFKLNSQLASLQTELEEARSERLGLEQKTNLLKSSSLDLDLLEEQAKSILSFAKSTEILLIENQE